MDELEVLLEELNFQNMLAEEGANFDITYNMHSKKIKTAKSLLINAKNKIKNKDYTEALQMIKEAKNIFKDIRETISLIDSGPISSRISYLLSSFNVLKYIFKKKDDSLSSYGFKVIRKSELAGARRDIVAFLVTLGIAPSLVSGITNLQVLFQNSLSFDDGSKAAIGFWNALQRTSIYVLSEYIFYCDDLEKQCLRMIKIRKK